MGVKGLSKLIKDYSQTGYLAQFKNSKIGIDTSLYMHKFSNVAIKNLQHEEQIDHSKIYSIVENSFKNFAKKFKKTEIEPLFIFDNKSDALKDEIINNRKISSKSQPVKSFFYTRLQDFFKKENIEFEISPELWEAEQYGAFLQKAGKISALLTCDLDSLAFGSEITITNIAKDGSLDYYSLSEVLRNLELDHKKFILMCIIMGTDFNCKGLYKYGPAKAFKFVKENTYTDIKAHLKENLENFEIIYNLFNKTI